ncbi:nucleotide exchange factor Fes1-domain-containing protein [Mycena pura]|uniref:Nucleotide exchange factor Fes1-domain-containing protein n=1 Tax=Mycena pura TaxID=153505 RepID=A0AAD6UZV8_9AGAR|nr:nucleotide exchange factor Fes1-domain-containing protein [Mycena pura]
MESLLRWGIENSSQDPSAPPPVQRQDLDPEIIDYILGKSDAQQMKDDMAAATDESQPESARIDALDHLEMLIEQIDNANNLEKLQLWSPLHSLISTAPTNALKMQALWVAGTAVQNNPEAQVAYLVHNPLPVLTSFLTPSPSSTAQTRSKAVYALSGLLKHNAPAVAALSRPDVDGWDKLREALQDPDLGVRRKTLFLLVTLLIPNKLPATDAGASTSQQAPIHANSHAAALTDPTRADTSTAALHALHAHGILDAVVAGLTRAVPSGPDGDVPGPDADFEEKGVALLRNYAVVCGGEFSPGQKKALQGWFKTEQKDPHVAGRWSLTSEELEALLAKVA